MKGRFLILTKNKSGSFVMETIWSVASLKQRLVIVDELKSSEVELKNDWLVDRIRTVFVLYFNMFFFQDRKIFRQQYWPEFL